MNRKISFDKILIIENILKENKIIMQNLYIDFKIFIKNE